MPGVLKEEDIENMLESEGNSLELKGSRLFKDGPSPVCDTLARAVSAFANSGGGRIILGVHDGKGGGVRGIDGGIPMGFKRPDTLEWLNNQLPELVDPPLIDFHVDAVQPKANESRIDDGKAVIVIDIGDSEQAPHQVKGKGIYYLRAGAKSAPANHRQVMDIANRRKHPVIEISLAYNAESSPPEIRYMATNTGKVMADYVIGHILLPNEFRPLRDGARKMYVEEEGIVKYGKFFEFSKIAPGRSKLGTISGVMTEHDGQSEFYWDVSADSAPMREGKIKFCDMKRTEVIG